MGGFGTSRTLGKSTRFGSAGDKTSEVGGAQTSMGVFLRVPSPTQVSYLHFWRLNISVYQSAASNICKVFALVYLRHSPHTRKMKSYSSVPFVPCPWLQRGTGGSSRTLPITERPLFVHGRHGRVMDRRSHSDDQHSLSTLGQALLRTFLSQIYCSSSRGAPSSNDLK